MSTDSDPLDASFVDRRYSTKNGVALWLRIFPAPPKGDSPKPWLLWIHGGAYCSGQHYQPRIWLIPLMHKLGIHVISIGYRLSPIVSLEEMLGDCIDAFTWCNNNLSKELSGDCDITRFAIGGDSSGGSLASLLGLRIQPMAKAIINIYGVSDLVLQQEKYDDEDPPPEPWQGSISEQDVLERLADRDPSHAVTGVAYAWDLSQIEPEVISQGVDAIALGFKRLWGVSDEEWVYNHRVRDQWELKRYIGYSKSMVTSILRINANTPQAEKDERLKAYSMPCLLEMARAYPPTVFLHGTGDNAVPVQESRNMAAGLKEMGVETLESYCEGEDHGWDNRYTSEDVEGYKEYIEPIGRFLERHLIAGL